MTREPVLACVHRGLIAAAALLAGTSAWAEASPWYLGVALGASHESNLYRISDQQVLNSGYSKSDTITTATLLGGLDQPIGRQRLHGTASVRNNRYQSNQQLNNTGYGIDLGLDWSTIEHVSGTISATANQNLVKFNNNTSTGLVTKRNIERSDQLEALARVGLVTQLTLEGSLGYRKRDYSAAEYFGDNNHQTYGSLGVRWRSSDVLQLGAALRLTQATYPHFGTATDGSLVEDRFKRQDLDLTASWRPSGQSDLSVRLSPTHTRYDRDNARDFSGVTGSLNWRWQATGKLKLNTLLSHDTGQSSDAVNLGIFGVGTIDNSRTTNALRVSGDLALSGKLSMNAAATYARRSLVETYGLNGSSVPRSDHDNTSSLSLGLTWVATRAAQLSCNVGADHRTSDNVLSTPYTANTYGCNAQFVLQ